MLITAGWRRGQPLRLILVGDGGPWIWGLADRLQQLGIEVLQILDIYHAREHIWKVAHQVLGSGLKAHQWADTLSTALKDQGAAPVLQALRRLHPRRPNGKDEVRKAIDYFTLNADRMHYTQYAAAGLPLGSGIVESSCRLVSGLRVKQPGMRWSLPGVQATGHRQRYTRKGPWRPSPETDGAEVGRVPARRATGSTVTAQQAGTAPVWRTQRGAVPAPRTPRRAGWHHTSGGRGPTDTGRRRLLPQGPPCQGGCRPPPVPPPGTEIRPQAYRREGRELLSRGAPPVLTQGATSEDGSLAGK